MGAPPPPPPLPIPAKRGVADGSNKKRTYGDALRLLHWKVVGRLQFTESIWKNFESTPNIMTYDMDWKNMEALMCKDPKSNTKNVTSKKLVTVPKEISDTPKNDKRRDNILDDTRRMNLGVLIATQFNKPKPWTQNQFLKAIGEMDKNLNVSQLKALKTIVMNVKEMEKLQEYQTANKGNLKKLSEIDTISCRVSTEVPRVNTWLDVMIFEREFDEKYNEYCKQLSIALDCSKAIHQSHDLQNVLGVCLAVGNFINEGHHNLGSFPGFVFSTSAEALTSDRWKLSNENCSLICFIVNRVGIKYPKCLENLKILQIEIQKVIKTPSSGLSKDVDTLTKEFYMMATELVIMKDENTKESSVDIGTLTEENTEKSSIHIETLTEENTEKSSIDKETRTTVVEINKLIEHIDQLIQIKQANVDSLIASRKELQDVDNVLSSYFAEEGFCVDEFYTTMNNFIQALVDAENKISTDQKQILFEIPKDHSFHTKGGTGSTFVSNMYVVKQPEPPPLIQRQIGGGPPPPPPPPLKKKNNI